MAEKKPTDDMNKRLSFKDFMTVEYKPGEDELVNYRAYRRRRTEAYSSGHGSGSGTVHGGKHNDPAFQALMKKHGVTHKLVGPKNNKAAKLIGSPDNIRKVLQSEDKTTDTEYSLEDILEVISRGERMRRKRATKFGPLKHKLKRGRLKAKRRFATKGVLSNRSRKSSRKAIEKKFTKGIPKSQLSIAQKQSLERKLERPAIQKRIALAQRRLMPKKRRQEIARKQGSWKK